MDKITIEEIIYKWFDIKLSTYDKLAHDESIYFYYDGEEYADIRIIKKSKNIIYAQKFHDEFSQIIPIQKNVFQGFMSKWVEDTFNLKGFTPFSGSSFSPWWLEIPKINN